MGLVLKLDVVCCQRFLFGIALVVGVVLSYALQPKGNAVLLALGVLFADKNGSFAR